MRFNDIGVGAEAVRVVFGVDNGVVLREKVGEKVSFLQALQRDIWSDVLPPVEADSSSAELNSSTEEDFSPFPVMLISPELVIFPSHPVKHEAATATIIKSMDNLFHKNPPIKIFHHLRRESSRKKKCAYCYPKNCCFSSLPCA